MIKIQKPSKKILLLSLAALLIIGGAGAFYLNDRSNRSNPTPTATGEGKINYDPPTKADAEQVERNKQEVVARQDMEKNYPKQQPAGKKAVKPTITYAGQYGQAVEAGAYVNGIFEDGGQCTATFTQGNATVTKKVSAVKNNNAVDCPVMAAQASEFNQKGTWKVVVSYDSTTASGASDPRDIQVQ